jgi:hypothetical protein
MQINFHSVGELPAAELSKSLCRVASFLQEIDPYSKIRKHLDLREHGVSGWPFTEWKAITFHELFESVGSPRKLLWTTCDDDGVFVGVAPGDSAWYLRFRLEWDEEGFRLVGKFDITLPKEMAEQFRKTVSETLPATLEEQDADAYFAPIGPPLYCY